MKRQSKLTPKEQEQVTESQTQQTPAREFETVEGALRHDASQIAVPPAIAERLAESIKKFPPPERTWWQRILGR